MGMYTKLVCAFELCLKGLFYSERRTKEQATSNNI